MSTAVRLEAVADVADGADKEGVVRVGFDFGAESGDAAVDAARRDDDGVAPDRIEDVVARQGAAGSRGEIGEQAEFLGGQLDLLAAAVELVRGEIQLEIAEAAGFGSFGRGGAGRRWRGPSARGA